MILFSVVFILSLAVLIKSMVDYSGTSPDPKFVEKLKVRINVSALFFVTSLIFLIVYGLGETI